MNIIIFTDIDGVFHDGNSPLFIWADHLFKVIEPYDAKIVIHSSWRLHFPYERILKQFPDQIRERIAGITEGKDPYLSVLNYINQNAIEEYIVLDDAVDRFPSAWIAAGRFIVCDPGEGLSSSVVLERVRQFLESFKQKLT